MERMEQERPRTALYAARHFLTSPLTSRQVPRRVTSRAPPVLRPVGRRTLHSKEPR